MILIDTNIFTRLSDKTDPLRASVKFALEHLDNQEELVVAPQCLYEFWVVMTCPRQNNGYGLHPPKLHGGFATFKAWLPS